MNDLIADYLSERGPQVRHPDSLEAHFHAIRKHFGDLTVDQIDRAKTDEFIKERTEAGRQIGTIDKQLRSLRAALNWAEREKRIERAPFIHCPGGSEGRERYLSAEEYLGLLDAAKSEDTPFHIRLFVYLALHTAQRMGPILQLKWSGVSFDAGKTGEITFCDDDTEGDGHTVPMHVELAPLLLEARRRRETDYVIEWRGDRVKNISTAFSALLERVGIDDIRITDLRHSWALLKLRAGVSVYEVAAVLGDDPALVWKNYAKHLQDLMQNAIQAPIGSSGGKKR